MSGPAPNGGCRRGLMVALCLGAGGAVWRRLERARAQALRRAQTEHAAALGAVLQSLHDGLAVVDATGRITHVNDRLCELTGRSRDVLLAPGAGIPYLAGTDLDARAVGEFDLTVTRPDGSDVSVTLFSSPFADSSGRVHVLKDVTNRRRTEDELRTMAREQIALRRAATAVASGADPNAVFALVANEVANFLGVDAGLVSKFDRAATRAIRVGAWTPSLEHNELPRRVPLTDNVVAIVYRTGRPARVTAATARPDEIFTRHGYAVSVSAPVRVGDEVWGAVTAASASPDDLPPGAEVRLARFAELVALTVANADARALLARQAATDGLTGLANHREFHERLRRAVDHAHLTATPLALAVFDLDHFKAVNDTFGHQAGDRVLTTFAHVLATSARYGELVARIGGEEFAWLLPASDVEIAWRAVERVRRAYAAITHEGIGALTVSAGVSDLGQAANADELLRLADGALYWAKSHGRDTAVRYSPDVVRELSATERAERLARNQALTALRALGRAVDTKDPGTARHTERSARIAREIARRLGWPADRAVLLHEAALLHDVGKLGIPEALLAKSEPLDEQERDRLRTHALLGAELVSDLLNPEQVAWVRGHHECWDGTGYPDGLRGDDIPEGAQILAVADAWDAMTTDRAYRRARTPTDALDECRRNAGTHFSPRVVAVLAELVRDGALPPQGPPGDVAERRGPGQP